MEDWTTILIVAVGILFSFFKAKYKDVDESDFEEEKAFEEKPVVKKVLTQDGRYISSRAIGSDVYVITSYYEIVDGLLSQKSEIPEINGEKIEADCIWIPEKINIPNFAMTTK